MRRILLTIVAAVTLSTAFASTAEAGCYRLGLTGYHWYRSCFGPPILYPHHRYCGWRYGHRACWYR